MILKELFHFNINQYHSWEILYQFYALFQIYIDIFKKSMYLNLCCPSSNSH